MALAVAAALAAARWYAMSTPEHFTPLLPAAWFAGEARSLTRAVLNAGCSSLFLVLLPLALAAVTRVNSRRLWGLVRPRFSSPALRRLVRSLIPGAVLLGVLAAALIPNVRLTYPVFRAAGQGVDSVLLSCGLTLALILATELFYRGAALFSLERGFGTWAVYLLLPVYVLDHLGAPTAELAGSLVAGALLGHLALSCRSLWPGFAVHACCALAVDLTSLVMMSR